MVGRRALPDLRLELSPYSVKVRSYFRYKEHPAPVGRRGAPPNRRSSAAREAAARPARRRRRTARASRTRRRSSSAWRRSTPSPASTRRIRSRRSSRRSSRSTPTSGATSRCSTTAGLSGRTSSRPRSGSRARTAGRPGHAARRARRCGAGAHGAPPLVRRLERGDARPRSRTSFRRQVAILEAHLAKRPYLFGAPPGVRRLRRLRPALPVRERPDSGRLAPQRGAARPRLDRTNAGAEGRRAVRAWARSSRRSRRCCATRSPAASCRGRTRTRRALAAGATEFDVTLEGRPFRQQAQKYHARSLAALRARYAAASDRGALDELLERTGCRRWLAPA